MTAPGVGQAHPPVVLRGRPLPADRAAVMAIINRTPDSFFDAGATFGEDAAMNAVRRAVADGADLVDIGGVKAGVGPEVTEAEEIRRVVPFVARVRDGFPDLPISVGILIDTSTSMRLPVNRDKVPAALLAADGAARVVLKLTKPDDEYMIMTFNEKMSVKQSFTSDKKKVTDLLYKNNSVGGSTHLYSAVREALKEIKKKAKNPRRALIVVTDVHDTSGDKVEDLQASIREMEIPVYTFGMRWDAWGVPGEEAETGKSTYEVAVLKMMAGESAGNSMVVDIPDLLSDYTVSRMIDFVTLLEVDLRGQYMMSYPTTPGSGAKAIRVREKNNAEARARAQDVSSDEQDNSQISHHSAGIGVE